MATIGPVAVGVTLAFAWNLAAAHPRHAAEDQARARASHAVEGGAGGRQDTRQARSG